MNDTFLNKQKEVIEAEIKEKQRQHQLYNEQNVYCAQCRKKNLGLLDRHKYTTDKGKLIFYCGKCDKEYCNKVSELKNRVRDITKIMETFGFYQSSDYDSDILFDNPTLVYYLIDKYETKITFDQIIKQLKGKEITEKNIEQIVDLEKEKSKIKRREKEVKLREQAEKEVYGAVKTKREFMDEDLKEIVYSKYDNSCAVCGGTEGLHIHHKDKNAKNNRLSNLILLCGVCHKKIHMKVR